MASSYLRSSKQGDVNDLLKVIGDLKRQLEDRKQACIRLKTENQRLEKEKKDLEKQLLAQQSGRVSAGGMSAKQRALQRAVTEQQRQLKAQAMQAARSSEDAGNISARVEGLEHQVGSLEAQVEEVREERDKAREETEQLRDHLARQSSTQQDRAQQEMESFKRQLEADLQIREKALLSTLEESKAEAQRLAQEAAQATETLKLRDVELHDKDQEIQRLKNRVPETVSNQQPLVVSESQGEPRDIEACASSASQSQSESPLQSVNGRDSGENGIASDISDHSILIVKQLERAATATKAAVSALVASPRGVEELPADVQKLYKEACDIISETEAVVASSLKGICPIDASGLQNTNETLVLLCSEQLLALQRTISKALAGSLQVVGCALDGAMHAGNGFKLGAGQEQCSMYLLDLLKIFNMSTKGTEQVVNVQIPAMAAKLQAASMTYVENFERMNWESNFLSHALQTVVKQWGDGVEKSLPQISRAVEAARQRIEDPAVANYELKAIQTLVQELSLQIGSTIHLQRSKLMKAALCEGQHFGPDSLSSHMKKAMENVFIIAERWMNAFPNLTSLSPTSAQAWQALSLRARRCLALESFKWIGYMNDIATDSLTLSGGRAQGLKIVMESAERFLAQLFPTAGGELFRINEPGAPLAGSDEAFYESKTVVNALKTDFVEAVALVERRVMQVLMTSVGIVKTMGQDQAPPVLHVTPASIGATHSVAMKRVALNLRRLQAAANGESEDDDIRFKAILLERTAISKTVFLVVDPKPYQGMAPTPEEKALDEHNKQILQVIRKVAGKLRWEVRNIKDIERLADEGVDEDGLLDAFDVILKPNLPDELTAISQDTQGEQVAETLAMCGVPVQEISLQTLHEAPEDEWAQQLLDMAIRGRLSVGASHAGSDAGVHLSAQDMDSVESAASDLDAAIRKAHSEFQQTVSSMSNVDVSRATKSLESEVLASLTSARRSWTAALKGVQHVASPETPSLEDCWKAVNLHSASHQVSEQALSAEKDGAVRDTASSMSSGPVRLVQAQAASKQPAGQNRYAGSTGSTESQEVEQGVTAVVQRGRRTSFSTFSEDDDDTVTQSFSELSRDF